MTRRTTQYLTFGLDHYFCAIPAATVKEIGPITPISLERSPSLPDSFSMRGTLIPLIDFRRLLGLGHSTEHADCRIVVIDCPHGLHGIHVDTVQSVIDLPALSIPDLEPGDDPVFFESIQIEGHRLLLINILHCLNPSLQGVDSAFRKITSPLPAKILAS